MIMPRPFLKLAFKAIPKRIPGRETVEIIFKRYRNCIGIEAKISICKGTINPLLTINDHTFLIPLDSFTWSGKLFPIPSVISFKSGLIMYVITVATVVSTTAIIKNLIDLLKTVLLTTFGIVTTSLN